MRSGNFVIFRIAGDTGENPDTKPIQQGLYLPQLSRKVVFTDNIDVVRSSIIRLFGTDYIVQ